MDKWQRVQAAVAGKPVDRPPVSAWRHFLDREWGANELTTSMLEFHRAYDWDFMKVNPRATIFAEAWGNRYNPQDYRGVVPATVDAILKSTADLGRIRPIDAGAGPFAEQMEALGKIRGGLGGEAPFIQTVFSPLSVLGFLTGAHSPAAALDQLRTFVREDPAALEAALDAVATSLASYARAVVEAGASGIFFAIVQLARAPALTREEYLWFGRPYDLKVLEAVRPRPTGTNPDFKLNVLHVCGDYVYFADVADYPVQAINWNSAAAGNPSLAQAQAHTLTAVMGGVDETAVLLTGSPADVTRAVEIARAGTGDHRTFITPGCAIGPGTPDANLRAMRAAAARQGAASVEGQTGALAPRR